MCTILLFKDYSENAIYKWLKDWAKSAYVQEIYTEVELLNTADLVSFDLGIEYTTIKAILKYGRMRVQILILKMTGTGNGPILDKSI